MRDHLMIGLTGPTGAGKSTVSGFFGEYGFKIVNADKIAREIMEPNGVCVRQLVYAFGKSILAPDGSLNRRALAMKAFSSRENTQTLNDITHPQIFLRTLKLCREYIDRGERKIIFDAPVLFESNSDLMCDAVVSVTAPKEVRISRLMQRDRLPREEIERRISAQKDNAFYESRSDFTIDGSQDIAQVRSQVQSIINKLGR